MSWTPVSKNIGRLLKSGTQFPRPCYRAQIVKLLDTLASVASALTDVKIQVLFPAPINRLQVLFY